MVLIMTSSRDFFVGSLGTTVGKVLGSDEGIKIGSTDGKVLGTIIVMYM